MPLSKIFPRARLKAGPWGAAKRSSRRLALIIVIILDTRKMDELSLLTDIARACFWQNLDKLRVVLDMLTFLDLKPCKRQTWSETVHVMRKWINHFTSRMAEPSFLWNITLDIWVCIPVPKWAIITWTRQLQLHVAWNRWNIFIDVYWTFINGTLHVHGLFTHPPKKQKLLLEKSCHHLVIILSSSCHSWWPLADHSLRHQHLLRHEAQQGLASSAGLQAALMVQS